MYFRGKARVKNKINKHSSNRAFVGGCTKFISVNKHNCIIPPVDKTCWIFVLSLCRKIPAKFIETLWQKCNRVNWDPNSLLGKDSILDNDSFNMSFRAIWNCIKCLLGNNKRDKFGPRSEIVYSIFFLVLLSEIFLTSVERANTQKFYFLHPCIGLPDHSSVEAKMGQGLAPLNVNHLFLVAR